MTRRTCAELGVCQHIDCPECDAFECEVACSPEPADGELYPWPRYPFAPGTIDGPQRPRAPRSLLAALAWVLVAVAAVSALASYLVERFA